MMVKPAPTRAVPIPMHSSGLTPRRMATNGQAASASRKASISQLRG